MNYFKNRYEKKKELALAEINAKFDECEEFNSKQKWTLNSRKEKYKYNEYQDEKYIYVEYIGKISRKNIEEHLELIIRGQWCISTHTICRCSLTKVHCDNNTDCRICNHSFDFRTRIE